MTTNDIDAIRSATLTDEPGNNTFIVWYDQNREPYAVYFRSDANAWGEQRWFNADQHGAGGTEPSDWHALCDELYGNDGPHLLVPGEEVEQLRAELAANEGSEDTRLAIAEAKVAELTAERDEARNDTKTVAADRNRLHEQLAAAQNALRSLSQAYADLKTDNDELAAEVDRVRQVRDGALAADPYCDRGYPWGGMKPRVNWCGLKRGHSGLHYGDSSTVGFDNTGTVRRRDVELPAEAVAS